MQNVEYKAECRDLGLARSIALALGASAVAELEQTDTYYRLPRGRLKKREVRGEPTEWIFYDRADLTGPKISRFTIFSEAEARERFAPESLGVWVVVKKKRALLMLGNVRIHLDAVEGLGTFVEFEALVSRRHSVARCNEAVAALRKALEPALGEPIAVGYSDLLAEER
jgi:adenylate cyclase class IV